MCGIAGFWVEKPVMSRQLAVDVAVKMARTIQSRGPDAEAFWHDHEAGISFAHRRLSILDLSPAGAQPMFSQSGRYVIIFNGEIYNHLELRGILESQTGGISWRGRSDTETLLAAIEVWGVEGALVRILGMFAFAVWDTRLRELYLARDRIGEKPLYYGWNGSAFLFGSELKALRAYPGFLKEINPQAVSAFFQLSYVPCPLTIYSNMSKLPPGTYLHLKRSDDAERPCPQSYWRFETEARENQIDTSKTSYEDAVVELESLLSDVVRSQMLSDVPLGSFLSGGIDSSLITALMQRNSGSPIRTFTIGFESDQFDESRRALAVARHLGTQHTEMMLTDADALSVVPELAQIFDEPFADSSQIPTLLLSRMARRDVTVALTGDGGDEVFGGYNRHIYAPAFWRRLSVLSPGVRRVLFLVARAAYRAQQAGSQLRFSSSSKGNAFGVHANTINRFIGSMDAIAGARTFMEFYVKLVSTWQDAKSELLSEACAPYLFRDGVGPSEISGETEVIMALDTLTYLPDDILVKVDRSAMSASLETRTPYLDARILDFAWKLPLSARVRGGIGKRILRDSVSKYLPDSYFQTPKQGFTVPLDDWLRGGLRDWSDSLLSLEKLKANEFLRPAAARKLWEDHLANRADAGSKLWSILMFQAWTQSASN